jgi:predicted phosphohydrolase
MVVCGTLGVPPRCSDPAEEARQLAALDRALAEADRLRTAGSPVFVLWHYPPFDRNREPGPVVDRLESAGVAACVYGHVHRRSDWSLQVQGVVGRVRYACVAADAIGFRPLRIGDWA